MAGEPYNIRKMVAEDMLYAERAAQVKARDLVAHQSKWAEAQASQKTNPKDAERERKSREEELRTTAQQLLIVRRARMEKLYAQEHEAWDKELGKRGLTLEADTL